MMERRKDYVDIGAEIGQMRGTLMALVKRVDDMHQDNIREHKEVKALLEALSEKRAANDHSIGRIWVHVKGLWAVIAAIGAGAWWLFSSLAQAHFFDKL